LVHDDIVIIQIKENFITQGFHLIIKFKDLSFKSFFWIES
jgi:hypothetical protein